MQPIIPIVKERRTQYRRNKRARQKRHSNSSNSDHRGRVSLHPFSDVRGAGGDGVVGAGFLLVGEVEELVLGLAGCILKEWDGMWVE